MNHHRFIRYTAVFWTLIALGPACAPDTVSDGDRHGAGAALIITTDYESGAYSTVGLGDHRVHKDIGTIHPDAVCRYDQTIETHFIIERFGADAIDVLNAKNSWKIARQYSVTPGSNPQDIAALNTETAYIARFNSASLLAVNPTTGDHAKTIDLSAYADDDGIPEITWVYHLNEKVYALLAKLSAFKPTDDSMMLVLDGESGEVEKTVRLSFTNPSGKLRYSETIGRFVLIETGGFSSKGGAVAVDGIVEYFDPETATVSGPVIDAKTLGGDIIDAVILNSTKGYAVVERPDENDTDRFVTELVSFDPNASEKRQVMATAHGFAFTAIELTPTGDELWLADRTRKRPGIRIFDTRIDKETTDAPINVGLPPFMICFGKGTALTDAGVPDAADGTDDTNTADTDTGIVDLKMASTGPDERPIGPGECPVPVAPTLTVIPIGTQLDFSVDLLPDARIETAVSEDIDAQSPAAWRDDARLVLDSMGPLKVFARVFDDSCETSRIFSHIYNVRNTLPTAAETAETTAIPMDSTAFVGWADRVESPVRFGESVDDAWRDTHNALGPAEGSATDILCLGRGGEVTLGFDAPIVDDVGFDFAVFENGIADDFLELAFVEVSSDGATFVRFDSLYLAQEPLDRFGLLDPTTVAGLAGKYRQGYGHPFDLNVLKNQPAVVSGEVNLRDIRYIRLIDVVGDGTATDSLDHPVYDPYPTEKSAGFDLDAVGVLHR